MNPYDVLGVLPTDDKETVHAKYRKLAKKFHPDLNPGNKEAEIQFKEISIAYHIILDPEKAREAIDEDARKKALEEEQKRQANIARQQEDELKRRKAEAARRLKEFKKQDHPPEDEVAYTFIVPPGPAPAPQPMWTSTKASPSWIKTKNGWTITGGPQVGPHPTYGRINPNPLKSKKNGQPQYRNVGPKPYTGITNKDAMMIGISVGCLLASVISILAGLGIISIGLFIAACVLFGLTDSYRSHFE